MKLLLLPGVFLITFHVVSTCPARAAMSNFNTTRFLGTWYNIKRSSNARVTYKCFQNHFSTNEDGAISMTTKYYNTSSASYISFPGVLNKMDAASHEAKFNLVRSDQTNSFYVLGTDYMNYAVMWWCGPKRDTSELVGVTWLSSRSNTLNATYQAKADQVLPPGDYLASDQSGCP